VPWADHGAGSGEGKHGEKAHLMGKKVNQGSTNNYDPNIQAKGDGAMRSAYLNYSHPNWTVAFPQIDCCLEGEKFGSQLFDPKAKRTSRLFFQV